MKTRTAIGLIVFVACAACAVAFAYVWSINIPVGVKLVVSLYLVGHLGPSLCGMLLEARKVNQLIREEEGREMKALHSRASGDHLWGELA